MSGEDPPVVEGLKDTVFENPPRFTDIPDSGP